MLTESHWIASKESTEKRPAKLCLLRSFLTERFYHYGPLSDYPQKDCIGSRKNFQICWFKELHSHKHGKRWTG